MNFEKIENDKLEECVYHGVSSAGLNVYVLPKAGFSKKYAIYSVNYGSYDVSYTVDGVKFDDPLGIAHFLEHKLFELPDGRNAFDLFADTGANANAFTSHNMTAYLFSVSDEFDKSLDILLSYVNDPYFTVENVQKEQGIIAQEIKMYDDDPQWRIFNNALSGMYEKNPIREDIAGSVESISHITKDVLYRVYNTFYRPDNMVLFIAGDVDINEVGKNVEKNVKKREPISVVRDIYNEKPQVFQKKITKKMPVSGDNFMVGFKDMAVGLTGSELLQKSYETSLILKMLFSESALLYSKLYNEGLINDTFNYDTIGGKDYSAVLIGGEAKDNEKTINAILKGIESYKLSGFENEEYDCTKKALFGSQIAAFNSLESVSNSFSANFFVGIGPFDFIDVFSKITLESVNARIKEIFPDNYTISEIKK